MFTGKSNMINITCVYECVSVCFKSFPLPKERLMSFIHSSWPILVSPAPPLILLLQRADVFVASLGQV